MHDGPAATVTLWQDTVGARLGIAIPSGPVSARPDIDIDIDIRHRDFDILTAAPDNITFSQNCH